MKSIIYLFPFFLWLTSCNGEEKTQEKNGAIIPTTETITDEPVEEIDTATIAASTDSSLIKIVHTSEQLVEILKTIKNGDTLLFGGVIKGPITLRNLNNITLLGNDSTFLYAEDSEQLIIELDNCKNIHIDGFYMTHQPAQAECQEGVISLNNCSTILITNNDISGSGYYGIRVNQSNAVIIKNNNIHDCSYAGINLDSDLSNEETIENNHFFHNGWTENEHIVYNYDYNLDSTGVKTYTDLAKNQLLKNKITINNFDVGYVYAENGAPIYNENNNLISTIAFGEKIKLFPLENNSDYMLGDSVSGKRQKVEYNNQVGWVNNSFVSRFPIPKERYNNFVSYLNDNCELVFEKRFFGYTDGEMYKDISIRYYKEGVYWVDDQGWEWGSIYSRVYNMTMEQAFFLSQKLFKEFRDINFPKDDVEHLLEAPEDNELGKVTRSYKAYFNRGLLREFRTNQESNMGAEGIEISYFNDRDILIIESFGF